MPNDNLNMLPGAMNQSPIRKGTPYFMGDQALVKFSPGGGEPDSGLHWLVDKANNTVRPFESEVALQAAFGDGYEAAKRGSVVLSPPVIDENGEITEGVLRDFSILGSEYAVKENGTSKKLDFSPNQLKKRYGKQINENGEGLAAETLDGLLNIIKSKGKEMNIPSSFINQLKKDSRLMAFYISALAYGEYTLGDIYSDILNRSKE